MSRFEKRTYANLEHICKNYLSKHPKSSSSELARMASKEVPFSEPYLKDAFLFWRRKMDLCEATPAGENKQSWDEKDGEASWSYQGDANIKNLDDALKFSKVDLNVWEVERHIFNTWTTTLRDNSGKAVQKWNVQVKVWFKRRSEADKFDWDTLINEVSQTIKAARLPKSTGSGTGVVITADFHFGAYVDKLIKTPDFNFSTLVTKLTTLAMRINEKHYDRVHLAMLGDFIESFTGLNHLNSWKGLAKGAFGMKAIILAFEILSESFISKINNLQSIDIVSGNHDRVTADKAQDDKGEAAELLAYMLKMKFPDLVIDYNPMVITKVYDNICYVLTHGHLMLNKKDQTRTLFEYGKQGMYNVLAQGHLHSREVKKTVKRRQVEYQDYTVVELDEQDFRTIVAPPLFTGNFYSESSGWTSSAGSVIIENNGNGKINYFDYCL